MKHTASIPEDEDLRIQDLYSFDLLDTPQEIEFDELLELANGICETPVSFISLIDKDRQWFKASTGIEIKETPREAAFCSHTILQDHVLTVKDATRDERFSDNPLVTNEMGVRFYAGAPIISPNGYALGAVCLMDTKPQEFSPVQERQLELIARQAARLIVLRKQNNQMQKRSQEILSQKSKSLRRLISGIKKATMKSLTVCMKK